MIKRTKKFVKEHKSEIFTCTVCIGSVLILGHKINSSTNSRNDNTLDKVNIEKILDDIQRKITYKGIDIAELNDRVDKLELLLEDKKSK